MKICECLHFYLCPANGLEKTVEYDQIEEYLKQNMTLAEMVLN